MKRALASTTEYRRRLEGAHMRALTGLCLLGCLLGASSGRAQMLNDQGPPLHRIVHKNTFAVRVNPLGLIYEGRFSYRLRLYENEGKALRDNFVGVGLIPGASPTFARIGPFIEFSPLTVLNVFAAVQFVQYFGTLNLAQGFPFAQTNHSDASIAARGPTEKRVTNGYEVTLGANLQVKLLDFIVRDGAKLIRGEMKLRDGETVYYDQTYDVGVPNGGFFFTNDLDVLWQGLDNKLVAGARYTFTTPFYEARHLDPTGATLNYSMHRVGPFLAYTFKMEDGAGFNSPTVFLVAQWWLQHLNRTGQEVTQALPLIAVGFQVSGDFLPVK